MVHTSAADSSTTTINRTIMTGRLTLEGEGIEESRGVVLLVELVELVEFVELWGTVCGQEVVAWTAGVNNEMELASDIRTPGDGRKGTEPWGSNKEWQQQIVFVTIIIFCTTEFY